MQNGIAAFQPQPTNNGTTVAFQPPPTNGITAFQPPTQNGTTTGAAFQFGGGMASSDGMDFIYYRKQF